ncbi:MAG: UPF0164 family protein [Elusimicrobia bacterium]|nr:UPF0164 family protein [Elusimicrobiota bacterium]
MHKILLMAFVALVPIRPCFGLGLWSSESYHPVGARATALGGAFTAIADDATAVYWNPAGLAQLKRPEVSIAALHFGNTSKSDMMGLERKYDTASVNFASVVWPLYKEAEKNVSFAVTYMRFLLRGKMLARSHQYPLNGDHAQEWYQVLDGGDFGYVDLYGASTGIDITKDMAVGLTAGWQNGKIKGGALGNYYDNTFTNSWLSDTMDYTGNISGPWIGAGLLWKILPTLKLGLNLNGSGGQGVTFRNVDNAVTVIKRPMRDSAAGNIGLSWRAMDNLTCAADFGRTSSRWFGLDTTAYHVGAEYVIPIKSVLKALPVRLGYYHARYKMADQLVTYKTDGNGDGNFGSAGFGLVFDDFQIETAVEHGRRNLNNMSYEFDHPSKDPTHADRVDIVRDQKDTTTRFIWSVIYYF